MRTAYNTGLLIGVVFVITSCNMPASDLIIQPSQPPPATAAPTVVPTVAPTETLVPLPIPEERPMVWFGPLPPTLPTDAGRPFIGSVDFMELFSTNAEWATSSNHTHVFLLYAEWVGGHATDEELVQIVNDLHRRGIALAVEGSPLRRPGVCGTGIESWGGVPEGTLVAQRIKRAGGTIHFYAMDAPLVYASLLEGPGACQWSAERVAQEIDEFIDVMRTFFPNIVVGDTEPLRLEVDNVAEYARWMPIFREVTGENLPFFHLDTDFGQPDWAEEAKAVEELARMEGVEFGIFYIGDSGDPSDRAWMTTVGERIKTYEFDVGGAPDHIMFQSWQDRPDFVLPESKEFTYTNLIKRYFEERTSLGVKTEGPGANLAYDKPVKASQSRPESQPEQAIDGINSTWWSAGGTPTQWIEIDLGSPASIAAVRLSVSQNPAGETVHQVLGRSADEAYQVLHEFSGITTDFDVLEITPESPWGNIRFIRVLTLESPSWVSWREIEILSPEGS